jgi:aminopeptidase N
LKEGLTVYRDQEFSADLNSRGVKRIEDAQRVRAAQFSEDSGPMAHPVRPDSYIKMDNFYTVTVYEKGAEVVRLYETILGRKGFRKGMDLYFQRHDGQAVTCDDFLAAMRDANLQKDGKTPINDFSGIAAWYSQAGTPRLTVSTAYDAAKQTFTIKTRQATPATPGQETKGAVLIPLRVGLLGADGKDLPLALAEGQAASPDDGDDASASTTSAVLLCDQEENTFVFSGVESEPVASLLRGFSAPVKLSVEGQTDAQLVFLFANDSDPFVRWDAGQRLALKLMEKLYHAAAGGKENGAAAANGNGAANGSNGHASAADANAVAVDESLLAERCASVGGVPDQLVDAFRATLTDEAMDGQFRAFAVSLPALSEFVDAIGSSGSAGGADANAAPGANPLLCHAVRHYVNQQLAQRLRPELEALVKSNDDAPGAEYVFDAPNAARRALKNKALALLSCLPGPPPEVTADLLARFRGATNMTDRINALACLADCPGEARDQALDEFWQQNKDKPLNLLKWLAVQAGSAVGGNTPRVKTLSETHPAFVVTNPNSCYSLYLGFARSAPNFHASDGSGYKFMADAVMRVDKINNQVASRLVGAFTSFKQYDPSRRSMMVQELKRIAESKPSANVYEIVSKSLETAKAAGIE